MSSVERVVLIDDSEADNFFHELMLRDAGFNGEIVVFESGETALAGLIAADLLRPTVIFLDINMPRMNGFTVAEKLVPVLATHCDVAIFILTSSDAREDRARAKEIPVISGYVIKPLSDSMLEHFFNAIDWDKKPPMMTAREYQI
jgi:response regulator RpfG family c-di-GMP phosphodiesterase